MASANKVLTAPLAIIKVDGVAIGKMKNIRVTETIRRGKVVGIGNLAADEVPALEWDGSVSCEFFTIDLKKSMMPGAINRIANTIEDWTNGVLLQEDGIQIDIMKRVKSPQQPDSAFPNLSNDPSYPQRQITGTLEIFASIKGCFLNREGFDISEGQISGRNTEFTYTTPILFPI